MKIKRWLSISGSSKKKSGHKDPEVYDHVPATLPTTNELDKGEHAPVVSEKHSLAALESPIVSKPSNLDGSLSPVMKNSMSASVSSEMLLKDNETAPHSGDKIVGYENFGSTCYCNSVLQCLYNLHGFRAHMLEEQSPHVSKIKEESDHNQPITSKNAWNSQVAENIEHPLPTLSAISIHKYSEDEQISKSTSDDISPLLSNNLSSDSFEAVSPTNSLEKVSANSNCMLNTDEITEKLHEDSQHIIVGRPTVLVENSHKTSLDDKNDTNQGLSSRRDSNKNQRFTAEQKKKAALARGPLLKIEQPPKRDNGASRMYTGLKNVFETISKDACLTGVVSPSGFIETLKQENVLFDTDMHQDAHEFLNFLLNELSEHLESTTSDRTENFINNTFQGILLNKTRCLTCDNVTSRDEPFLDLPVEVKEDEETNIQSVLENYHQREMLNGSNKFYCDECSGLQEAERLVGVKQLPKILSLHLKRFKYSEEQNSNIKLFNKIFYPLKLNVSSTFDSAVSKAYELTGIIVHMGGGPQHGHYVAICKHEKYGWLLFDDETVESVSEDSVLKYVGDSHNLTTAYVLFYSECSHNVTQASNLACAKKEEYEHNIEKLIKRDEQIREQLHLGYKPAVSGESSNSTSAATLTSSEDAGLQSRSNKIIQGDNNINNNNNNNNSNNDDDDDDDDNNNNNNNGSNIPGASGAKHAKTKNSRRKSRLLSFMNS